MKKIMLFIAGVVLLVIIISTYIACGLWEAIKAKGMVSH